MPGSSPQPPPPTSLRAELSLLDLTFLVMGGIVGAGIFFSPHDVAEKAPTVAGITVTWLLGGVIALTGAFVFAEIGGLFPRTGGQYVYLREAFGRGLAFFYGWNLLAMVSSGALAVVAGVCVINLDVVLRHLAGDPSQPFLSQHGQAATGAALLIGFTWINIRGVKLGASVHNVLMALKVACLLFVIGLGAYWSLSGKPPVNAATTASFKASGLAPALLAALFSFGGWQNAASVAGEVRDARRVLPKAILLGTSCVVALYVGLNLALTAILGPAGVAATTTPVSGAVGAVLGPTGSLLTSGIVVLSTAGITHALILMTPRVYYAMARDGTFIEACGREHPRYGTPHFAIAAQSSFALAHWLIASYATDLKDLIQSLVFADWVFFTLTGVAYFLFRRRIAAVERPYSAPLHPWTALVFTGLSGAIVAKTLLDAVLGDNPRRLIAPAVVFAAGGVLFLGRGLRRAA